MGIGKILANLIEERKMNVNELAKNADISPSTLYSIIKRDSMKVDIDVLIKVSKCLAVSADYFYDMYEQREARKLKKDIFSAQEENLVKKYRALDDRGKKAVEDTLEREYGFASPGEKEHSAICQSSDLSREEIHRLLDKQLDDEEKGRI